MRAQLQSLDTADAPGGALDSFQPDDSGQFGLAVTATIGPADGSGGEQFEFLVCSASWLAAERRPKGLAFHRTLLLDHWSPNLVERAIADLCRNTGGQTWQEIALKLSRYALGSSRTTVGTAEGSGCPSSRQATLR